MHYDGGRRSGENDVVWRITEAIDGTVATGEVVQVGGTVEEGELLVVNGFEGRGREVEREKAFGEAVVRVVKP